VASLAGRELLLDEQQGSFDAIVPHSLFGACDLGHPLIGVTPASRRSLSHDVITVWRV
jgi:hypothetical protein